MPDPDSQERPVFTQASENGEGTGRSRTADRNSSADDATPADPTGLLRAVTQLLAVHETRINQKIDRLRTHLDLQLQTVQTAMTEIRQLMLRSPDSVANNIQTSINGIFQTMEFPYPAANEIVASSGPALAEEVSASQLAREVQSLPSKPSKSSRSAPSARSERRETLSSRAGASGSPSALGLGVQDGPSCLPESLPGQTDSLKLPSSWDKVMEDVSEATVTGDVSDHVERDIPTVVPSLGSKSDGEGSTEKDDNTVPLFASRTKSEQKQAGKEAGQPHSTSAAGHGDLNETEAPIEVDDIPAASQSALLPDDASQEDCDVAEVGLDPELDIDVDYTTAIEVDSDEEIKAAPPPAAGKKKIFAKPYRKDIDQFAAAASVPYIDEDSSSESAPASKPLVKKTVAKPYAKNALGFRPPAPVSTTKESSRSVSPSKADSSKQSRNLTPSQASTVRAASPSKASSSKLLAGGVTPIKPRKSQAEVENTPTPRRGSVVPRAQSVKATSGARAKSAPYHVPSRSPSKIPDDARYHSSRIRSSLQKSDGIARGSGTWPPFPAGWDRVVMATDEISCELCEGRCHWGCAGVGPVGTIVENWICPDCKEHVKSNTTDLIMPAPPDRCIRAKCLKRRKVKSVVEEGDEERYHVSKIIGRRAISRLADYSRVFQYLVLWDGYPLTDSTWEPTENLSHDPEGNCAAITAFLKEAEEEGVQLRKKVALLPEALECFNPTTGDMVIMVE